MEPGHPREGVPGLYHVHMSGGWGGRRAQAWTRAVLANATEHDDRGRPLCMLRRPGVCTTIATTGDHIIPRILRRDLQYVVANGQPACGPCNSSKGRTVRLLRPVAVVNGSEFFESTPPPEAPDPSLFHRDPNKTDRVTKGQRQSRQSSSPGRPM